MTYTNDECRQNALKLRQENDWFAHSDGPVRATATGQKSPRYSNEQHRIDRPSSAKWWNEEVELSRASRHDTPESRKIRQKLEAHNQHDWYKHGPGVPDPPALNKKGPKSRRSACSEARAKLSTGDSNQWFKHDNSAQLSPPSNGSTSNGASPSNGNGTLASSRRNKEFAGSISWLLNESPTTPKTSPPKRAPCPFDTDDGSLGVASQQRGNTRIVSPDADCYQRRNNEGTASQWYAPKENSPTDQDTRLCRKAPIRYAFRLDAESEDWYSFRDASKSMSDLNGARSNRGATPSPGFDSSSRLTRFVANSTDELDRQTSFLSEMDLNGNGIKPEIKDAPTEPRSKWDTSASQQRSLGFKNFVRLDDYFEPTWSVMSDDLGLNGEKL